MQKPRMWGRVVFAIKFCLSRFVGDSLVLKASFTIKQKQLRLVVNVFLVTAQGV